MQNIEWKEILTPHILKKQPSSRWAHSSCIINETIIIFGGYANTNYMNDLWGFNTITLQWQQIETTGKKPLQRSNPTMHYDNINNRIIIFGGGAKNKERYITVSILDWKTKVWTQLIPKTTDKYPWQRTYHTSQLVYPYLIVFGGQGVEDYNDLWIFNLKTLYWKQIKIEGQKPSPRKFHTSSIINNKLYIIGGCCQSYKVQGQIYSIDIQPLLQDQQAESLLCQRIQFKKDKNLLYRWGHTTNVFNNKIYMIGGRNKQNLNDIIQIDPQNRTIKQIDQQRNVKRFAPRRKHICELVGSSLVVFGGYSGSYFNDLHFCNLFDYNIIETNRIQKMSQQFNYNPQNQSYYQAKDELIKLIIKQRELIVVLTAQYYDKFVLDCSQYFQTDFSIQIGDKIIPANKSQMASKSLFFKNILSNYYQDIDKNEQRTLSIQLSEVIFQKDQKIIEIIVNYLCIGKIVISEQFTMENWFTLSKLANYFSLENVLECVDRQLCSIIDKNSFQTLDIAIEYGLQRVSCLTAKTLLMAYPKDNLWDFLNDFDYAINKCKNRLKICQQFYKIYQFIKLELKHNYLKLQNSHCKNIPMGIQDNNSKQTIFTKV